MRSRACARRGAGTRSIRRASLHRVPIAVALLACPAVLLGLAVAPAAAHGGAGLVAAATAGAQRAAAPAVIAHAAGLAGASAAAAAPRSAAACATATTAVGAAAAAALRAALQCVVDAERARHGLRPMLADARLARAARRHARDMVRRRYFAHEHGSSTLTARLRSAGWSGGRAAEAIAWGCGDRATPLATLQAWLNSPPHRAILLGSYGRAGIGLAVNAPTERCAGGGTWVLDTGS